MKAAHVVDAIVYMANLSLTTNVLFMTMMANRMRSSVGGEGSGTWLRFKF
jgi:hypothetical protein